MSVYELGMDFECLYICLISRFRYTSKEKNQHNIPLIQKKKKREKIKGKYVQVYQI